MRRTIPALAALGAIVTMPVSAEAAETVFQPTSAWTLDYGDEKCSLVRDFGALDEGGWGLRIDSYGGLNYFQVHLIGKDIPRARNPVCMIDFRLSADEEARRNVPALHGTIGEYRFVQFGMAMLPNGADRQRETTGRARLDQEKVTEGALVRPILRDYEEQVDAIVIALRRGREMRFETGSLGPAMDAMRTCIDDLRASWGLDSAQQRSITRLAHPDVAAVKDVMKDYPRDLVARGINGYVPLRVMVDATGAATECVVQLPQAPEEFREAACQNLGTRFYPALGADGEPVASFYQTSVIYLSGRL